MVCKEEVFMWFKELTGSKRIGVVCGLLNMCYPLELRFLGTCLEDLGKKDFYCFQEAEQKANNVNEIRKLIDLKDNVTRCKFIVSLALLHSSNHVCSNVLYQTLSKHLDCIELFNDQRSLNEMLLVITMALNHPAFTFDQKTVLTQHLLSIEKLIGENSQTNHESHTWQRCASAVIPDSMQPIVSACQNITPSVSSVAVTSIAPVISTAAVTTTTTSSCPHHHQIVNFRANEIINQARISSLKVKSVYKRRSYRIRAIWSNGRYNEVIKTCHDIVVFHQKLLQLFPQDVHTSNQDKYIPPLPGVIASQNEEITEETISALNDYLRQLTMHLPIHVLECDHVINFFKLPLHGRVGARNGKIFSNDSFPEDGARVPSITIYNSHRADGSSRSKNNPHINSNHNNCNFSSECSVQSQTTATPPVRSPISSPVSSPYVSPPHSGSSSRSASPWIQRPVRNSVEEKDLAFFERLLKREHLHEYFDKLKNFKVEDLQCMRPEKFEHLGISKATAGKIRKILDNLRNCSSLNGVTNHLSGINPISAGGILSNQGALNQISSESSPSCSEYSSPPPSPPLTESSQNQQSIEKIGLEENLIEKGNNSKSENDAIMQTEDKQNWSGKCAGTKLEENQCSKENRIALGISPSSVTYAPAVLQIHPNVQKTNHLPVHGKNNSAPPPLGTSTVIFENGQYTNFGLPSAVSFLSHSNIQRSHSGTPERVLPASTVVTVTTVCPFPVTSGCTTPTSCMATYRNSGTGTMTTASLATRHHCPKNLSSMQTMVLDSDNNQKMHQQPDIIPTHYTLTPTYLLPPPPSVSTHHNQPATCTCACTVTSSSVPSSVTSSTPTPGTAQQPPHPVSLPFNCVGFLPHIFPQTFPFIPTHNNSPANGLISPAMTPPPPVHNFPFPLANGLPPELIYARQSFPIPPPSPSPSSVPSNPTPSVTSGTASFASGNTCYSKYCQSANSGASAKMTCYNCGKVGHRGTDCKESAPDDGRHYINNVCKSGNN